MIASYAMRGRMQAIQLAMLFFVLALILPPLSILGSAIVGLVTLRQGGRSGLEVGLGASLATGLATWLLLNDPGLAIASLLFWAPLWGLALLLRYSGALGWTLQWGLLIGLLPWLMEWLFVDGSAGGMQQLLEPMRQSLTQAGVMTPDQAVELMDWLARWLVALVAGGLFLQLCLGLFLARGWQARLYNPGGFAGEFRRLRFSRALALLAAVLLLLGLLAGGAQWSWLRVLTLLLLILFFLQGLAVLHALLGRSPAGKPWLIGVYVLLFLAMPYMGLSLAATGYVDIWRDFRRAAEARANERSGDDADL
ncbi:MAG: YybS family protein [Gammaproteobacteria bacterium SHHR-1]|uniref:DUF2232 domain-containing protein n=1 Tax=Magnetovirga frankeli TaxID=947516 RepID=UPI0012940975|nr:DUF2232 domain-containing protein [gamma proteobacterium SS-5]